MSLWDSPSGEYFTDYESRMGLVRWKIERIALLLALPIPLALPFLVGRSTWLFVSSIYITAIAVIGLNVILGYAGEIVLAQGAFMAIGAYTTSRVLSSGIAEFGLLPALLVGGLVTAVVAMIVALPSFRVKGFYIAITTLALQFISEWFFANPEMAFLHGGAQQFMPSQVGLVGGFVEVGRNEPSFYYLTFAMMALFALVSWNLSRTGVGRALRAVRDNDLAAAVLGINVYLNKLLAFSLGGFIIGVSGGLYSLYIRTINPEFFTIQLTIDHYVMLIFGGLGHVWGALLGTGAVSFLLDILRSGIISMAQTFGFSPSSTAIRPVIFGFIIIAVLILEPKGIVAVLGKIKEYLRNWPYAY